MKGGFVRAIVLVVFLTPGALAGTEANPEVDDHPDIPESDLDLLSAWVANEREGLRFTVKVVRAGGEPTDRFYWLRFDIRDERFLAGVGFDGVGNTLSYVGPAEVATTRPESWANTALREPRFRPGAPAYFSGLVPWGAVQGFHAGSNLEVMKAGASAYHREEGRWETLDARETHLTFALDPHWLPEPPGPAPIGIPVLTFALGGAVLGGGTGLARAIRTG